MGLFDCFKSLDLFGYEVKLNVDKQNRKHKTWVGTCFSLIYLMITAYVFFLIAKDSTITLTETII